MNHSITKAEFYTCTIHTARTPSLQEVTCEHSSANPSLCSLLIATATRKGSQLLRPPLAWYTSFLFHPAQHPSPTFYSAASQPSIPAQHPSPVFQHSIPTHTPAHNTCITHSDKKMDCSVPGMGSECKQVQQMGMTNRQQNRWPQLVQSAAAVNQETVPQNFKPRK